MSGIKTVADFPGSWLGRRVTCAGHTGRLDGFWNLRGGFQLVISNRTGIHETPPLAHDTPIALEEAS